MSALQTKCPNCGETGTGLSICQVCGEFISMTLALTEPIALTGPTWAERELAEIARCPHCTLTQYERAAWRGGYPMKFPAVACPFYDGRAADQDKYLDLLKRCSSVG